MIRTVHPLGSVVMWGTCVLQATKCVGQMHQISQSTEGWSRVSFALSRMLRQNRTDPETDIWDSRYPYGPKSAGGSVYSHQITFNASTASALAASEGAANDNSQPTAVSWAAESLRLVASKIHDRFVIIPGRTTQQRSLNTTDSALYRTL